MGVWYLYMGSGVSGTWRASMDMCAGSSLLGKWVRLRGSVRETENNLELYIGFGFLLKQINKARGLDASFFDSGSAAF